MNLAFKFESSIIRVAATLLPKFLFEINGVKNVRVQPRELRVAFFDVDSFSGVVPEVYNNIDKLSI